jgi:hypothetical protein
MKFGLLIAAAAAAALAATAASADILIDFDGITSGAFVDGFYAGGTDSLAETGPNLGVTFNQFLTTSNFGETSQPNLAYDNQAGAFFDSLAGFKGVSFTYGAFSDGQFNFYSGFGGTGTLVGVVLMPANNPYAPFDPNGGTFSGVAHSGVLVGGNAELGVDDLTLKTGGVPEPAEWALMIGGLGLAGATLRRRRAVAATA